MNANAIRSMILATAICAASSSAFAQETIVSATPELLAGAINTSSSSALPEAPSAPPLVASVPAADAAPGQGANTAPKYSKYIAEDETALPITAHDKVVIGLRDLYSPMNFAAIIASAGYEQALNGSPNYGTNKEAFGKRVGAAAVRETSQGLFTDTIMSPILHTDPRYYVMGTGHNFFARTTYAVTRVLVTKTDGGHHTVNAALLIGYAGSSALTTTYYPQVNRNFHDVASDYGGSLGGAALGFFITEFSDQFLKAIHLKK